MSKYPHFWGRKRKGEAAEEVRTRDGRCKGATRNFTGRSGEKGNLFSVIEDIDIPWRKSRIKTQTRNWPLNLATRDY